MDPYTAAAQAVGSAASAYFGSKSQIASAKYEAEARAAEANAQARAIIRSLAQKRRRDIGVAEERTKSFPVMVAVGALALFGLGLVMVASRRK